MKAKTKLICAAIFLALFIILIVLLKTVDISNLLMSGSNDTDSVVFESFGMGEPQIGLSSLNMALLASRNDTFFDIAEYLGYLALLTAFGFACFGVYQLVKRKSFAGVDRDIYLLAALYIAVLLLYFIFDKIHINYRPVIIDGALEESFPSSHTMLAICVFVSAILQFKRRIKNQKVRIAVCTVCGLLAVLTTVFRYLSGVHWFIDILGGILISASLLFAYSYGESKIANGK